MNYFIYSSHHFTPHGRYELNKLTSLQMCGFIAQLVEHRISIEKVTGSNPVEALMFSGFFFPIASTGKFTAMIILHFRLQPQFKYELFHIYFTSKTLELCTNRRCPYIPGSGFLHVQEEFYEKNIGSPVLQIEIIDWDI